MCNFLYYYYFMGNKIFSDVRQTKLKYTPDESASMYTTASPPSPLLVKGQQPAQKIPVFEPIGEAWLNFIGAIRSPDTKVTYVSSLEHFAAFCKKSREITTPDDLLKDPVKLIEARVMGFIAEHKDRGLSYGLAIRGNLQSSCSMT